MTLSVSGAGGAAISPSTGTTNSAGQFTTTLSVDPLTATGATITVTATSGPLTNTDTTTITGGATLTLTLTPAIAESQAGGINAGRANTVTATLTNASGTGLSGHTIAFGVTGITGTYSATTATTDASGVAAVTLTPDTWTTPGTTADVTATAGSAAATSTTLVLGANALASGWNRSGQLGVGTTGDRYNVLTQPLTVFPSPIKQIASGGWYSGTPGYFTFFVLEDGSVWSVGLNARGQLGLGDTNNRTVPTRIAAFTDAGIEILHVAAGDNNGYAVSTAGRAYSWGAGASGSNGNDVEDNQLAPGEIPDLPSDVEQVAAQSNGGFARTRGGALFGWGVNANGQLGDGTRTTRTRPVTVGSFTAGVRSVVSGSSTAYALLDDGSVAAWGRNSTGRLGNGSSVVDTVTPETVSDLLNIDQIEAGYGTAYARRGSEAFAWGTNSIAVNAEITATGMVGDGSSTNRFTPVSIADLGSNVTLLGASAFNGYALMTDGSVKAWGYNYDGQLADNQPEAAPSSQSPITVPSIPSGRAVVGFATGSMSAVSTLMITAP